jgi:hypothetical protein
MAMTNCVYFLFMWIPPLFTATVYMFPETVNGIGRASTDGRDNGQEFILRRLDGSKRQGGAAENFGGRLNVGQQKSGFQSQGFDFSDDPVNGGEIVMHQHAEIGIASGPNGTGRLLTGTFGILDSQL